MNFHQSLKKSEAFSLQTSENNLKPPYNPIKDKLRFSNGSPLEGAPENVIFFVAIFRKY